MKVVAILGIFIAWLCVSVTRADETARQEAAALIHELRDFPPELQTAVRPSDPISPMELRRIAIYDRLAQLNRDATLALCDASKDPDVLIRRNVTLALAVLPIPDHDPSKPPRPQFDIRPCLPALIDALGDTDGMVRARAAQAIGLIGADAAPAVPSLVKLLENSAEGSRIGACIALRGIGPDARAALPMLHKRLEDPSEDVRQFATRAIERIQGQSAL